MGEGEEGRVSGKTDVHPVKDHTISTELCETLQRFLSVLVNTEELLQMYNQGEGMVKIVVMKDDLFRQQS